MAASRVAAHLRGDQAQRSAARRREGVGMQVELALVGQPEQPHQLDRVALEHVRPVDVEAAALLVGSRDVQLLALAACRGLGRKRDDALGVAA